jgi:hypothetical protein
MFQNNIFLCILRVLSLRFIFTRQENTPFGNIPATKAPIWQQCGNNNPILATDRQQTPDSGNRPATNGN